jgi:molecular chaperone GrpE (heat shock protein)
MCAAGLPRSAQAFNFKAVLSIREATFRSFPRTASTQVRGERAMSKPPSDKTIIATLKRQLREDEASVSRLSAECHSWRNRATKAEQEAAEWKKRFDILLSREPKP